MEYNYTQIKLVIENDQTLMGYFDKVKSNPKEEDTDISDVAIKAIEDYFNTQVDIFKDVPVTEFASYLDLNGLTEKVRAASTTNPVAGTVARIAGLESSVQVLEISNPEKRIKIKAILDVLVTEDIWTQDEANGVFDLAKTTEPIHRQYGGKVGRGIILLLKSGRV